MPDHRRKARHKVFFGGVADVNERGSALNCIVRNLSEDGALVEFESGAKWPEQSKLSIARKDRCYLAQVIWRQANRVGLAFRVMVTDAPESELDARLRRSEQKKLQLERRIAELLGEG